jgi:Ca2+-binding RTX toxin-like protein
LTFLDRSIPSGQLYACSISFAPPDQRLVHLDLKLSSSGTSTLWINGDSTGNEISVQNVSGMATVYDWNSSSYLLPPTAGIPASAVLSMEVDLYEGNYIFYLSLVAPSYGFNNMSVFVRGGDGDDHLIGSYFADEIQGESGDDYINGGEGNDFIYGGGDNDELHGGDGHDGINGDGYVLYSPEAAMM